MKRLSPRLSLVPLLFLFAACSAPLPAPIQTTSAPPTAQARIETLALPTLTDTPIPTLTRTLTATWTVTPGPTNTVTPAARFDQAQVIAVNFPLGGFQIVVRLPGVEAPLNLELEGRKYTCQLDPAAPDLLFCNGLSAPSIEQSISMVFTNPADGSLVWQGKTLIIRQAVPTETPVGFGYCKDRGKDMWCEVECRIHGDVPCLVATCNDACGPYYGINTCPDDVPITGICDKPTEMELRARYGIP
jgi:hypothetical protein